MDIYVTFYIDNPIELDFSNKKNVKKNTIFLSNGFSFGREKKPEDIDLFFNSLDLNTKNKIKEKINIYKPNKIWVSLTYDFEALSIYEITDDRWIIGGPLVSYNINNKLFSNFFSGNPTFVYTSIEEYLGKQISNDFDPYFLDFSKNEYPGYIILYNISLGLCDCYWGKCNFCSYTKREHFTFNKFKRNNIKKIIQSALKSNEYNIFIGATCLSSLDSLTLDEIIKNNSNSMFHIFMRADHDILKVIKKYDDLTGYIFTIGLEAFSQKALDILNKGIKIKNVLELTKEILRKNGNIRYTLMKNYTFLTEEIVNESIKNIKKFKLIYKKYSKNKISLQFVLGFPVMWDDKEKAEENNFKSFSIKEKYITVDYSNNTYVSIIPKNDKQFEFNEKIKQCLIETNMPVEEYYIEDVLRKK